MTTDRDDVALTRAERALRKFCDEWPLMRGQDPDLIYGLHVGDERACSITLTDLRALLVTTAELRAALIDMVDSVDPEPGAECWDLSPCDYYRKQLGLSHDGSGTCSFQCRDEPACQTTRPEIGWPLERARRALETTDGK